MKPKLTIFSFLTVVSCFYLSLSSQAQTCGGTYVDSGGVAANYSANEMDTVTICPDVMGDVVYLTFTFVDIETSPTAGGGSDGTGCWDYLQIYNGADVNAPLLGNYCGELDGDGGVPAGPASLLQAGDEFISTDATGCLTFVFLSDGIVQEPGWEASIVCAPPPACPDPSGLGAVNVLNNTADIFWTAGIGTSDFNVEWDIAGFALGTGNLVPVVGDTSLSLSGLAAATDYEFYVQGECGVDGTSGWVGPFPFTTTCDIFVAPYTENFDNGGTIPNCWTTFGAETWLFADGTGSEPGHGGNNGNISDHTSGTGFFAWINDSSPHNLGTTLESPLVDINGLTAPALSFWINSDDEGDANGNVTFKVDFYDGAAWNTDIYTSSMNTNGWFEVILDLSGFTITGPVRARFIVDEDNGTGFDDDFALDDVSFAEAPSCFNPMALGVTGITATSADLFWSAGGGETDFNVEWGEAGFSQGTGNMVSVAGDTSITISGLMELTTYEFYVQADCGANGTSAFIGPFSFSTPCNTEVAPYLETFDNGGAIPDCWETFGPENWLFADGTGSEPGHGGFEGNIVDHTSGTGYFAWINDSSPHGTGITLESPLVDLSGETAPVLSFWINSDNEGDVNGNVTFFVDFWDGAAWNNAIYTSAENTNGWLEVVIDLTTFTITGPVQVRFIVDENNGTGFDDDFALDDVYIGDMITCEFPTGLGITDTMITSVTAFWTAAPGTTNFNVEYGLEGFSLGSGTQIQVVGDTSAMISGLSGSTDYEFYVQADCGVDGGQSIWSGPFSFTTLCDIFIAPYTENFDNGGMIPNCWSTFGNELWLFADGSLAEPGHGGNNGNIVDHTSGTGYFAWINDSSPHNTGTTLESPMVDVSGLISPALIFWINSDDEGDANGNVTFFVDFWDGAAWNNAIYTSSMNTNGWLEVILDLTQFTITGPVQARFIVDEDNGTGFDDDFALDDVAFVEGPSCFNPLSLGATNVTSMTADLFWSAGGGETDFNVEWGETGFSLGSGNMISVVGDTSTTISGLMELTTYEFYVQADCGANGMSAFIGPFSFTTPCNTIVAPYLETFDNSGIIPDCWATFGAETWLFADGSGTEPAHGGNNGNIVDHTSGTGYFAWINDSSPHNTGTTLESPLVDVSGLTSPALIFWINSDDEGDANGNVTFFVDFWDGAAWNNAIYTSSMNTNGWLEVILDLTQFTITGPVRARFIVDENNGSGFDDDFALDDVAFDEGPACFNPTGLGVTNVTSMTADLLWTPGGSETNFNIEWDTTGFTLSMGNMVSASSTTVSISGLEELTTYDFYVQADCGPDGVTDWVGPFSFTTPCNTFTAPYLETFDNGGTIPDCWATFGAENWLFADGTAFEPAHGGFEGDIVDHTSGTGYFAWINDSSPHSTGITLESPLVDVSGLLSPGLFFWINSDNEGDANGNVDFSVDFWDGAAWNTGVFTSNANTNGWMEVIVDLSSFTITGPVQARFIVDENNGTGFDDDFALDDVAFDNLPLCPGIDNLLASNITTNSADISWTSPETSFNVEYGEAGFGLGTGIQSTTAATMEPLSGLAANTEYDVYVQADCSGGISNLLLTGVIDGPLPGGLPKAIEIYVAKSVPDLSIYGLGSANNGGGTDGEEYTFPPDPAAAGEFLYLTTDSAAFHTYFGFATPYVQSDFPSAASINGDDAVELFENGIVIDVFGDINVDGTGQTWEYLDGWAYRNSGTVNNIGVFTDSNWMYSGVDALDGDTLNATSGSPWPIGSFEAALSDVEMISFRTLCDPVQGDSLMTPIPVPSLPYMDINSTEFCYTNQYIGRDAPDIIYQFTTGPCADSIRISTCSDTTDFDTYVYLLDDLGAVITFNDDAAAGTCAFTLNGLNRFSIVEEDIDANTTYFVVVDGFDADESGTFSLEIEEIGKTAPSVVSSSNVSCNGFMDGSIDVDSGNGTVPFTYMWTNGATTEDLSGLAPGMYGATITDADGCVNTIPEITITEPDPLVPDFTTLVITNVSCFGESDGAVSVDIIGGTMPYTYNWSTGATTAGLTGLAAGSYTGTVTDANGCIFVTPIPLTITEPGELDVPEGSEIVQNVSCNGAADGSVMITPTGGTPPYTFEWSTGETAAGASFSVTGLAPGMYGGTITDANGCTINNDGDLTEITEPDPLLPDFTTLVIANVSCNGESDGAVQIDIIGGTEPYTFLWSNGATTEDLSGLAAGSYTGTVTDANGCTFITPVPLTITEPDALTSDAMVTDESALGANDGAIDLTPAGGTEPYTFDWSNGATTEDLADLAPDTYSVTVTDANGCMTEGSWTVMEGPVGVNNIHQLDLFDVSPNPTGSEALLRLRFSQSVDIRVKLVNALGQVLFTEIADGVLEHHHRFNMDQFTPGVYYVHVLVDGKNAVKPIVLAR